MNTKETTSSIPAKRARDEYAEETISDLSDGELDAAIIANPIKPDHSLADMPDAELLQPYSDDEDDEDDDDRKLHMSLSNRDEQVKARLAVAHAAMLPILASLTEDQQRRYETFRRVGFPRPLIKKMIAKVWGQAGTGSSAAHAVIVVAGIAKVYVGELVEEAAEVAREWGDAEPGRPLLPSHYREAHRRLVMAGRLLSGSSRSSVLL